MQNRSKTREALDLPPGMTGPEKSAKTALRALVSPFAKLVRIERTAMA